MATEPHSPLYQRLKRLAAEKGWSMNRLAREAAVDRSTMERAKSGRVPQLPTLIRLARALGEPLATLTGAEGDMYTSLQAWMDDHPETDDDLADWLWSQSFRFGDPGPSTWDLLAAVYNTARSQAEARASAPSAPKRR